MSDDSNSKSSKTDTVESGGLTRRDFLTSTSAVAAGLVVGVSAAEAAGKPKKAGVTGAGNATKRPKTMLVKNATVLGACRTWLE